MVNYIQVPVPEEHVPKVIGFLADLNRDLEAQDTPKLEENETTFVLDSNLVLRMYLDSETRHRKLLNFLASHPGQWFFTSQLARELGVDSGTKGMAGVFGAFGRRAKHRYSGAKPWEMVWDSERGEAKYRMDPRVATWVKEAI